MSRHARPTRRLRSARIWLTYLKARHGRHLLHWAVATLTGSAVLAGAVWAVTPTLTLATPAQAATAPHYYDWHGTMPTGITLSGLQAFLFASPNVLMMDRQAQAARRIWKGNTDRIQVIQDKLVGADGQELNGPYLRYIQQVVSGALHAGLTVVINDQTEVSTGYPLSEPLPTQATAAFWRVMMRYYANNPRIDFDLFNEPRKCTWAQWQATMQPLVGEVRAAGARNQIWVDGINWGSTLEGVPLLHDPLHDIVYTIHHPGSDRGGTGPAPTNAQLDAAFGNLAAQGVPVVDAEFANYRGSYDWYQPGRNVRRYLAYLTSHHVGMLAWSLLPGALNSSMDYASVSREPQGDGAQVRAWFAATAKAAGR